MTLRMVSNNTELTRISSHNLRKQQYTLCSASNPFSHTVLLPILAVTSMQSEVTTQYHTISSPALCQFQGKHHSDNVASKVQYKQRTVLDNFDGRHAAVPQPNTHKLLPSVIYWCIKPLIWDLHIMAKFQWTITVAISIVLCYLYLCTVIHSHTTQPFSNTSKSWLHQVCKLQTWNILQRHLLYTKVTYNRC